MGGVVKTGEKVMGSDSVYVTNLDVSGIPDGIIKLTVQLKDSLDQLVATTTIDYTKDVILPNSYYFQSNLQNLGTSNIDELEITINTVEVNGEYELTITGDSIVGGGSIISEEDIDGNIFNSGQETVRASRIIRGNVNDIAQTLPITDLSNFADGLIKFDLVVTDSALNVGSEIYKDSIYKETISNTDTDGDGVTDNLDQCPGTSSGATVDANGCADSQKDTDGDGVTDDLDQCPGTSSGATVDNKGCELPLFIEKVSFIKKVYPNPARKNFIIEFSDAFEVEEINMVDPLGKMFLPSVKKRGNHKLVVDVSEITRGANIILIKTDKGSASFRIIVE
jgi:hypothetical protein